MGRERKKNFSENKARDFLERIRGRLRTPDICDMESSAFLQVAALHGVPALVIRCVSDSFEGNSADDFSRFIEESIDHYVPVVDHIITKIR